VPSFERSRLYGASNLHAISDGWRVLSIIARESRALRKSPHMRTRALAELLKEERANALRAEHEHSGVVLTEEESALRLVETQLPGSESKVIDFRDTSEAGRRSGRLARG
jgi:hypothetical protein